MNDLNQTRFHLAIQSSSNVADAAEQLNIPLPDLLIFFTNLTANNHRPYHFAQVKSLTANEFSGLVWNKPKAPRLYTIPFEIIHAQILSTDYISQASHALRTGNPQLRTFLGHFTYQGNPLTYAILKKLPEENARVLLKNYSSHWEVDQLTLREYSLEYLKNFFRNHPQKSPFVICNLLGFTKKHFTNCLLADYNLTIGQFLALPPEQMKQLDSLFPDRIPKRIEVMNENAKIMEPSLSQLTEPRLLNHPPIQSATPLSVNYNPTFFKVQGAKTPMPNPLDYSESDEALIILGMGLKR